MTLENSDSGSRLLRHDPGNEDCFGAGIENTDVNLEIGLIGKT